MNISETKQIQFFRIIKNTFLFLVFVIILVHPSYAQDSIFALDFSDNIHAGQVNTLMFSANTPEPGPIIGDMLIFPKNNKISSQTPLQSPGYEGYEAGFYETSEYMIGDVAVGIIFLESNANSENWDTIREKKVISEIEAGLNWWAAREPEAKLTFTYDIHYKVPTGYEPINRPQSDESLWISDAMTYLGYTGYPSYFDNVLDYNNALRVKYNTDWAYTIFVIDSNNDADGMLSDGYFAYAYLGGPFTVITYDNDGYGIENMDAVIAHETGHIFYANDQYTTAHSPCAEITGYLAVPNQNSAYPYPGACKSNDASIMRSQVSPYTNGALDIFARQQIGWRDNDTDGIPDIIDFIPDSTLNAYSYKTIDSTVTYTGKSTTTTTYPNNNPHTSKKAITINKIKDVEYRVDGSSWISALPVDGSFNSSIENFTFTTLPLSDGTHTIEVRALNTAGNWETDYPGETIIIHTNYTNFLINPGFEAGTTSWKFYTNGAGTFKAVFPGYEGNNSANLALSSVGSNMQLYQSNIKLEPNTRYRVSFAGRSTQGHDVRLRLFKQISPYPMYGLDYTAPLDSNWGVFTTEFNTSGFTGNVSDGRLQFYLVPFAKAGDTYNIDDVRLEKIGHLPPELPEITTHPAAQTVVAGLSATFSVVATGGSLSYQWQKNGVNISGAISSIYTTPLLTMDDNGAAFRVIISNEAGSITSNDAILTVSSSINLIKNPGFESGKTYWSFYTNTAGPTFTAVSPGYEGNYAANLALSKTGTNMQLYQSNIKLEPNTRYRVSFAGRSTQGHDVRLRLFKQISPYPMYGLDYTAPLDSNWGVFTTEFNTSGFTGNVSDGRLQFYLVPFAKAGDTYNIDNVILEKVVDAPPIPPEIIGNAPSGTDVPVTTWISVNFSKPMNQASVQSAFSTIPATTGSFSWNANTVTYTPGSTLNYSTTYSVTVGTGAMDSTGNNMLSSSTWQFTTVPDSIPPEVIGNTPIGANIPVTAKITVTFSEAMNKSSAQSAFLTSPVTTGTFSWTGNTLTYTPDSNLFYLTTYNVTVGTGASDLFGNNMPVPYEWNFTSMDLDLTPPEVIDNSPNGSDVSPEVKILVNFSEAMNKSSVQSAFSTIPSTNGTFKWIGNNLTYIPDSIFLYNTVYNITIADTAKDLAGNTMASYSWQFTTAPKISINLIKNPGFESGNTSWKFYTNGTGSFTTPAPGYEGNNSAMLYLSIKGSNIQFYQHNIVLEPDTRYRLNFAAYSTTGHDMTVKLFNHVSPKTSYMPEFTAKLGTGWETFSTEFTTPLGTVTDARLQFWLSSFAASGDTYFIDAVSLEKVIFNDTTLPNITIWYGNSQRFGHIGVPQQWVNVLGNAYDISGIASLNYSLNNGITQPLSTGPDGSRLQSNGDFNIEINRTDLVCGDNQIAINATDHSGNTNSEEMTVQYSCGNTWPGTYSINWSNVGNIQDAVQVVDGLWIKEPESIRPLILGYDRLVAIGDISWDDYEIAVPVTINSPIYSSVPYGPNFGILMRWQGHYARDSSQPRNGWWPLGALGVYIWVPEINDYRLRIIGNNMQVIAEDTTGKHLSANITYMFKMRVQTIGTSSRYSLKVWEKSKTEPSGWTISGYGPVGELKHGSLMLNSHYVNVSFGNVTVSSGPFNTDTQVTTTQEAVK